LWLLGHPQPALADTEHALTVAREIGHSATLMYVLNKSARSSEQIYAGWANPNGYRLFKILSERRVGLGRVITSEVIGLVAQ